MEVLLEGIGMLIFLAVFLGVFAYGVRNRGKVITWLENNTSKANKAEIEARIVRLKRNREDADAEIAEMEEVLRAKAETEGE